MSAAIAGLLFFALSPAGLQVHAFPAPQQDEPATQPPAPIVRVQPHTAPRPAPRPLTTVPGAGAPAPPPSTLPGTAPAHRPRPQPAASDGTTTPAARVTPGTPKPPTSVTPTPKPAPTEHKPTAPAFSATGLNRNIVVLDPAHGGTDSGARIGDTTLEKNVTLAFAFRLRSLLVARGFTVVMTRDSDTATPPGAAGQALTLDDRAGIANHARAAACLLIHATGRGMGVHLYNSDLTPTPAEPLLLPWLTAQSAWVLASQSLEGQIGAALGRSHIQLVSSTASVRPVDSLTCPALVLELAPETEAPTSVNDAGYQSRVAGALAGALVIWARAVQPPVRLPGSLVPPRLKKRTDPLADPLAESSPQTSPQPAEVTP